MPEQDLLLLPRFFLYVFLVLLFWWSFSFFITQEVIVLHVIRVSSSELGLCNSPGFINSRWESIFPGESVMPLLRILYLVKTLLLCTNVKWTHVPCVIIVFCTCKEDLFPLYLLIWKAVLPFSKTFLHHVYPLWELSDFQFRVAYYAKSWHFSLTFRLLIPDPDLINFVQFFKTTQG